MFQPHPTPFASSCFAPEPPSYAVDLAFGLGIPPLPQARGGGGGAPSPAAVGGGSGPGPGPGPRYGSSSSSAVATRQQQQQQQQQQLASPPQLPPHFEQPAHHHHHHHFQHPQHHHYAPLAAAMEEQGSHDMAAQQEAAKDYQPVLEGPLVGDKTPSDAITHEYAKADPVYVDKTAALPQTYSHYRPIQGDGNCGWRAIGFSYFEKLVESGDQDKIEGEVARLMSLNHMLSTVGGYTYFEDWADEMTGLLRELATSVGNPIAAQDLLRQRWNDASVEGGLIYYLRLLAATYLKANAATYDPFVPDGQGVQAYCSQSIELVNREIEHLGIVALVNVLLKPADLVLEIAYLDRSPGSQVNHHRFTDEADEQETSPLGVSVIYLLYRPDHYDILYRTPDNMPVAHVAPAGPVSMQVNRVSSLSHDVQIASTNATLGAYSTVDFGALAMLPGFGGVGGVSGMSSMPLPPTTGSPVGGEAFSPVQPSPWASQFADDVRAPTTQPPPQQPPVVAPAQPPTPSTPLTPTSPMGPSPSLLAASLGMETQKRPPMMATNGLTPAAAGYPIRFSPVQLEYEESKSNFREPTFQVKTNTFKNSVWNRAHYGNPDFHPEEWMPEDEGSEGRTAGKKKCRKDKDC
ncbi:Ubiquitin thioesterase OTUB1 [Tolypocladium paradoxum]|uniref:ubiquitinyl hydrolase 1 n=1 Tax=Tolypocladium paradoxum TaxID=94208 RepID=A0A2S4KZ51_9HYPO|nr:Ubiquitin thioesterase OTUB1 [Tolypocladium paradoxum]